MNQKIIIGALFLGTVGLVSIMFLRNHTALPTKTPILLTKGFQEFPLQTSGKGPKLLTLTIEPLDADVDAPHTIAVRADTNKEIKAISAIVLTDNNKSETHTLNQHSNDRWLWSTTYVVSNTHIRRYQINIVAVAQDGSKTSTQVTVR